MHYSTLTRRYFAAAPGAGSLTGCGVATGIAGSREQGAWVQLQVRTEAAVGGNQRVVEAGFLAFGCPHIIAVAAWLAEQVTGRLLTADLPLPVEAIRQLFDAPVEKLGRLLVVEDAWRGVCAAAGV